MADSKGIRDAIKSPRASLGWRFRMALQSRSVSKQHAAPDSVSIYVVYVDNQPVTSAWIIFNGSSPFAGIWGGAPASKHFEVKGHYSLLLNKRIEEAKSRGVKYLTIDASDMSKPIVSKRF
ncbi:hypothetical protein OH492_16870 [Vibrio chagasii]|nr:hypothetical protein [Vibrio chagasii]